MRARASKLPSVSVELRSAEPFKCSLSLPTSFVSFFRLFAIGQGLSLVSAKRWSRVCGLNIEVLKIRLSIWGFNRRWLSNKALAETQDKPKTADEQQHPLTADPYPELTYKKKRIIVSAMSQRWNVCVLTDGKPLSF